MNDPDYNPLHLNTNSRESIPDAVGRARVVADEWDVIVLLTHNKSTGIVPPGASQGEAEDHWEHTACFSSGSIKRPAMPGHAVVANLFLVAMFGVLAGNVWLRVLQDHWPSTDLFITEMVLFGIPAVIFYYGGAYFTKRSKQ